MSLIAPMLTRVVLGVGVAFCAAAWGAASAATVGSPEGVASARASSAPLVSRAVQVPAPAHLPSGPDDLFAPVAESPVAAKRQLATPPQKASRALPLPAGKPAIIARPKGGATLKSTASAPATQRSAKALRAREMHSSASTRQVARGTTPRVSRETHAVAKMQRAGKASLPNRATAAKQDGAKQGLKSAVATSKATGKTRAQATERAPRGKVARADHRPAGKQPQGTRAVARQATQHKAAAKAKPEQRAGIKLGATAARTSTHATPSKVRSSAAIKAHRAGRVSQAPVAKAQRAAHKKAAPSRASVKAGLNPGG